MKYFPLNELFELVGRFPEGISLEELLVGLGSSVSRRTLQRNLSNLVNEKKLIAIGKTKARRYKLPVTFSPIKKLNAQFQIILSSEGEQIQKIISQPIQMRLPVSYERSFLESYLPNKNFYLSKSDRQKLNEMGGAKESGYPAGTFARQVFQSLLIDLSWNSSRLEGNTYSLLDTIRLLEKGQLAQGKDLKDAQMILNHKAAIEFLIESAEETGVNRFTILNLHTLLSDNLLNDPSASGRLRFIPVGIGRSVYQPSAIPQVINECFNLLINKAHSILDPFEQAFFLMVHLPYLQPFDDVNKRTSRLAANIPLIQNNLCPLSFIDVPEEIYINALLGVYELNRTELLRDVFMWAYQRSCLLYATTRKSIGDPDPFRMKYRQAIQSVIHEIVQQELAQEQAVLAIRKHSKDVLPEDRSRFMEMIENDIRNLHEGNLARYRLRPSEYEAWKKKWSKS